MVHRAGSKHRDADAMSRLPTDGTDREKLDDDMPVSAITTNMASADETEQEQEALESWKVFSKQEFNPYRPELYTLADLVDQTGTDIPNLPEFIEAQSMDPNCHQAVTSVEKPNSTITYNTDGLIGLVSTIDGASQRFLSTVQRPRILRSLPLLAIRRTCGKTSYVRYDAPWFLLVAHSKWCLRSSQGLSVVYRKPPNQQQTKKALLVSTV